MSSTGRRAARLSVLIAAASLALAACAGDSGAGDSGTDTDAAEQGPVTEGGSITFAVDSPFLGFDPNVTPAAQDARVLRQVFDSLLTLDEDKELHPWLASEWDVSEDGLTYNFSLRDDVTFHDGTPFNAEAVCYNLDRIKNPETASIYAIGLIGPYESCEARDEFTAEVTMASPFAPFLNNLTSPFMGINSPTAAAAADPADYTLAPVGSGPFRLENYIAGGRVELTRYEDYDWAPEGAQHEGPAYLEEMTFQIIPDPTVRVGSVRNGTVEAASNIPETEVASIESNPELTYITQQQSGAPYQLHFNTSKAPFDDPAVRQAARAALDIDSALNALYLNEAPRAWGPLTPQTIGYNEEIEGSFEFDAEAAAQLLEGAGWVEGSDGVRTKDGQRLTLTYREGTPNREKRQDLANFFEANLEDVGFEVNTIFEQAAVGQAQIQNGDYNIAGLSLVAVDPNVMYQMYDPRFMPQPGRSGFNLSMTDEPELTELLAEGQAVTDQEERVEIYGDAQVQVIDDARSVGIYVPRYTLALNGLQGLRFDAEGYPILYDAAIRQ